MAGIVIWGLIGGLSGHLIVSSEVAPAPPVREDYRLVDVGLLRTLQERRGLAESVSETPTPTPTPTLTPTPQPPPPAPEVDSPPVVDEPDTGRASPADGGVESIICSYPWPQGCAYALAVVKCESTFQADVDSNWPYVGWWQIDVELHDSVIKAMGYVRQDMYSGGPNTAVAWRLSSSGTNMAPWPRCRYQ